MDSDFMMPKPTPASLDADLVLENAHEAFVAMDSDGLISGWNKAAGVMFGWNRSEVLGRRLAETIIPAAFRGMHEEGLRTFLKTGVGPVLETTIEVDAQRRTGELFPIELTITPYRQDDGEHLFGAFLSDVTDRRRLQRWQRASERVAWALVRGKAGPDVPAECLAAIGDEMGFSAGLWWCRTGDLLQQSADWVSAEAYRGFVAASDRQFAVGEGLPGAAWELSSTIWSTDVTEDPRFLRLEAAREYGLHTAVYIPASSERGLVGVFEFVSSESRAADEDLVAMLTTFGGQVGTFLDGPADSPH